MIKILDNEANAAAQRYGLLVDGWQTVYARVLEPGVLGNQLQIRRAIENAYQMARIYLETEKRLISEAVRRVAENARTATIAQLRVDDRNDADEALGEHLLTTEQHLEREITIQIERDIAHLQQSVRRTAIQVAISARSQNVPVQAAYVQHRAGAGGALAFHFRDRRNRRWPSRTFVRSVWRESLLDAYNETVLLTLADYGKDQAQVIHIDPNSNLNGMLIAITAGGKLPTYDDIRGDVFHPNSNAVLGMVR